MSLDLSINIRDALLLDPLIVAAISSWLGSPSIHTRRPIPESVSYPLIIVSPDIGITDEDGLTSTRPVVQRDIICYGLQPSQYRTVETVGYYLRELFHRKPAVLIVSGYHVIDIQARGPSIAPVDDEAHCARMINLFIRLRKS